MKTYFAKYLPVEGEIKQGVKAVFSPTGGKLSTDKPLPEWVIKSSNEKGFKLGKLFLCSRDIQVGDEIIYEITNAKFKWDGNTPQRPEDFKVIGEISPEATWVKEGDEFEEEQLKFWKNLSSGLNHQGGFVVNPKIRPDWQEWVTDVQIKGPCGHFH